MIHINTLFTTFAIGLFSVAALFWNYRKKKKANINAGKTFLTGMLIIGSFIIIINLVNLFYNNYVFPGRYYDDSGYFWILKGDNDKALNAFNKAIQLNPNLAEAYCYRGLIWEIKGDNDKALIDFKKTIKLESKHFSAYNDRGYIWLQAGKYDKALDDFNKSIQLKQNNADAYYNRAFVYLNQDDNISGCRDARKACELGNCKLLEWAKSYRYCH